MVAEKSFCGWAQAEIWCGAGGDMVGGAQQNRVTPSPFDFGLWTWTWIVTIVTEWPNKYIMKVHFSN